MHYDRNFYDAIRPGVQASADAVVPYLVNYVLARSVSQAGSRLVDIGCGEGWWAKRFEDHGYDVIGVDGPHMAAHCQVGLIVTDLLRQPIPDVEADVALCLEVAEHLPRARAEGFIRELVRVAPVVVFSAAIPKQGGAGHVNEQWPMYWDEIFDREGFSVSGALRFDFWNDDSVEPWYRQNLLLAVRHDREADFPDQFGPLVDRGVYPLVHPKLWEARVR